MAKRSEDPGNGACMTAGALTLGQVAERTVMLDVTCSHCARRGLLSVPRLLHEHGAGMAITTLLGLLTADCSRRGSNLYQTCGAHFPHLPVLFRK